MGAAAYLPGPSDRARPNILVTGTPGTGKTTTASLIAEEAGMTHVDVSALVKKEVSFFLSLSAFFSFDAAAAEETSARAIDGVRWLPPHAPR